MTDFITKAQYGELKYSYIFGDEYRLHKQEFLEWKAEREREYENDG